MQTLREALEPFAGQTLTPAMVTRMREVIEEWGNETGHIVYPVSFDLLQTGEEIDPATFDLTFECVPKDLTTAEWLALLKKPTDDSGTK